MAQPRADSSAGELSPELLREFVAAWNSLGGELHALRVLQHGHTVGAWEQHPYTADIPHAMFSVSKSVTSTAVGLAVADGLFSIDDTVRSFFPAVELAPGNRRAAELTVRDLLTMATGQENDPADTMRGSGAADTAGAFFAEPFVEEPGTRFRYSSGATRMLAEIVTRVVGSSLSAYLEPRLWRPLGIDTPHWELTAGGIEQGATGLRLRIDELATFGQLYLQGGVWQNERLLPEDWVRLATSKQVESISDRPDWQAGYGFQFWRSTNGYRADGAFGQFALVLPEQDAVIAITAGFADPGNALPKVWRHLLPALEADRRPSEQSSAALFGELGSPAYVQPEASVAPAFSGARWAMPGNPWGIAALHLRAATDGEATLTVTKSGGQQDTVRANSRGWTAGRGTWPTPEFDGTLTSCRGGWIDPTTYELTEQFLETPFARRWIFDLAPDSASVKLTVRVDPQFWQFENRSVHISTAATQQ